MPYHAIWLAPCEKSNRLNKTNLEIKKKNEFNNKKRKLYASNSYSNISVTITDKGLVVFCHIVLQYDVRRERMKRREFCYMH